MKRIIIFSLCVFVLSSCVRGVALSDEAERAAISSAYAEKMKNFPDMESSMPEGMTEQEREAMEFLYAYMPASDVMDYTPDYYLENVRVSFEARENMPWGKTVPAREFKHFVLPVRVNNENLDSSRMVFYNELKDRVAGLSMRDAVLEVNHWCHEKVVYRPSDPRTSSPLASVKTAFGRCGEESTFTVAALRSVGIPARQVYTPRWAHTDDNHAWVEAWVDGEWCFLGACEPEPVLNLAWFNAPASRAMLMHTKVFGDYNGPEDVMSRNANFTEINVIDNYVDASDVNVIAVDKSGKPVEGADVEFKIYNYAEYFTVKAMKTASDGRAFLRAGKGDLVVWASKDDMFGISTVSFRKDTTVNVVLDRRIGDEFSVELDIVPPVENPVLPEVTEEQRAMNTALMAREDSVRLAYTSTFFTPERADYFCKVNVSSEVTAENLAFVKHVLVESYGNHQVIENFLKKNSRNGDDCNLAIEVLKVLAEKDWRDVVPEVLDEAFLFGKDFLRRNQAMTYAYRDIDDYADVEDFDGIWKNYVLSQRVGYEMLSCFRYDIPDMLGADLCGRIADNPDVLTRWCVENLRPVDDINMQQVEISPVSVLKYRASDRKSREIFYVAVLRSLGIPARINQVTSALEYMTADGIWNVVEFDSSEAKVPERYVLGADYRVRKSNTNPQYSYHYSIAEIRDMGGWSVPATLGFPDGEGGSWKNILDKGTSLDKGYYMITSGTRLASGTVLVRSTFVNLDKDRRSLLVMREGGNDLEVIGSFNSESRFRLAESGEETSVLLQTGRGYFVVALLGAGEEPTNHAIKDIALVKDQLEEWGRGIIFLFEDQADYEKFRRDKFENIPSNVIFGIDEGGKIREAVKDAFKYRGASPLILVGDTFNRVVFFTGGYTVGVGNQLMQVVHKL